jgi:hypothetical protein
MQRVGAASTLSMSLSKSKKERTHSSEIELLRDFPASGRQSTISLYLFGVGDRTKRLNVDMRIRRSRVRWRASKNTRLID